MTHPTILSKNGPVLESDVPDATLSSQEVSSLNEALLWIPEPPPAYTFRNTFRLEKPVAIPRMEVAGILAVQLPFLRAYSPALLAHDIKETDFLAFIDNLAVAQAPSPPLQVLNIASTGIGMVPHHWATLTSMGIGAAAGVGTAAISSTRTKRYLGRVNEAYFNPRGLQASIIKDAQLATKLQAPEDATPLVSTDGQLHSLRDRRIQSLAPYLAPITLNVPPPDEKQRNLLDSISARQIKSRVERSEKKMASEQQKLVQKQAKKDTEDAKKAAKDSEELEKKLKKRHKKHGHARDEDSMHNEQQDCENKESLQIERRSGELQARQPVLDKKWREIQEKERKQVSKMEYILIEAL